MVPRGARAGTVMVVVAVGVASEGVTFTVTAAPSITSLTPNTGAVGSSIVIAGSNFGPTIGNGNVKFNGTSAAVKRRGASSKTGPVPIGESTGSVMEMAAGGVASSGGTLPVTAAPTITSSAPNTGAVGS